MAAVNPYLTFNGTCEEAFNFYKAAFGGEFLTVSRFSDMPAEHYSPGQENQIMHVSLPIGKHTVLMGSDQPGTSVGKTGDNFSIAVATESEEETKRIFNALAEGGKITMPLGQAPWAQLFGMLTDKYGFLWMVNYDLPR